MNEQERTEHNIYILKQKIKLYECYIAELQKELSQELTKKHELSMKKEQE